MHIPRRYSHSLFLLVLASVFLLYSYSEAAINEQIPFYGTLVDSGGTPQDGTFDMVFRFYDAASGGTLLDTSTHTAGNGNVVTVTDGEFFVLLGSGAGNTLDGVDFDTADIYIGLSVEADPEMTPRERLGAAPYAFNSDTVDGYDADQLLRYNATGSVSASSADTLLTFTQSGAGDILNIYDGATEVFTILDGGNVGIATSTPGYDLTIDGDTLIAGGLYDSAYSIGTNGYVLQSDGTGINWVATSTLGLGGGSPFTTSGFSNYLTDTDSNLVVGTSTTQATSTGIFVNNKDTIVVQGEPTEISLLSSLSGGSFFLDAFDLSGDYLYGVSFDDEVFYVIDISDPTNMIEVGSLASSTFDWGSDVDVSDKYAYVVGGRNDQISVIDISDPTSPSFVSVLTDLGSVAFDEPYNLELDGNYAYVSLSRDDSVVTIDMSDPENLRVVATYRPGGADGDLDGARFMELQGDFLYVSVDFDPALFTSDLGIAVLDVSDPLNITTADLLNPTPDGPNDMIASGRYLYVSEFSENSIGVYDIQDPYSITRIGGVTDATVLNDAYRMTLAGDYLYVGALNIGPSGYVTVIDISSSTDPQITGSFIADDDVLEIGILGNKLFASTYAGIYSLDIASIDTPSASIGSLISTVINTDRIRVEDFFAVDGSALIGQSLFVQEQFAVSGTSTLRGFVGIGTSTPTQALVVDGDLLLTGSLIDSNYTGGANGFVLQSTGSGTQWVATSTLGLGGGSSLFTDGGATTYLTSLTDQLSIGTTTASSTLTVLSTTPQLHLGYDASNYVTFNVDSTGDFTLAPSGGTTTITSSLLFGGAIGSSENILAGLNDDDPIAMYAPVGGTVERVLWVDVNKDNYALGRNAATGIDFFLDHSVAIGSNAMRDVDVQGLGDWNVAIGTDALRNAQSLDASIAIGYSALATSTDAGYAIAIGQFALSSSTNSTVLGGNIAIGNNSLADSGEGEELYHNIAIGQYAGYNLNGGDNIAVGTDALRSCNNSFGCFLAVAIGDGAAQNSKYLNGEVALGADAMENIATTTGFWGSVAVGYNALQGNASGVQIADSVAIGGAALENVQNDADENVALGTEAGRAVTTGSNNIFIGHESGESVTTGSNNIVIGYDIDAPIDSGDNQMTIGNLIFATGLGALDKTVSTGNVGIGTSTPSQKLTVSGTIQATNLLGGAVNLTTDVSGNIIRDPSDERLKENVAPITQALDKVLQLKGVSYEWKDKNRFGDQVEIGFIAQDVDLILPEVVRKGGEYWSLNTRNILAVVVEAIKEMWIAVSGNQEKITELESRIETLEAALDTQYKLPTALKKNTSAVPESQADQSITSTSTEDTNTQESIPDTASSSEETSLVESTDDSVSDQSGEDESSESITIEEAVENSTEVDVQDSEPVIDGAV